MTLPDRIYTEVEIEKARRRGKMIGWVQGGAVVAGGLFVLSAIGWIPTIAVVGLGGYVVYKLAFGRSKRPETD